MSQQLRLKQINLAGYKSIEQIQIPLDNNITLLIGPNGAGKSNLLSFFRLLNHIVRGGLQVYVGQHGYASSLLYYGPEVTEQIEAELLFQHEDTIASTKKCYSYRLRLAPTATGQLFFKNEALTYQSSEDDIAATPNIQLLGQGHSESLLKQTANGGSATSPAHHIYAWLQSCRVYQFHNTTQNATFRSPVNIHDNHGLRDDAGNLAALLYALQSNPQTYPYYARIVRYIQHILPQFNDFDLTPSPTNPDYIQLTWHDNRSPTYNFGPHQLSDGSLRFMALATLLLQPPHMLPQIIILDEPELGLHPSALTILEAMIQIAAQHTQVVLATQSSRLVDEFNSDQIVIVEQDRESSSTICRRVDTESLHEWLQEYRLSELWAKNVLGGLP